MTYIPLPTDAGGAVRVSEQSPSDTKWIGPESLLAAAQNFTAAWADCGTEIPTSGSTHLGIWLTLDVNDSLNMRVKALAKHTSGGTDEYELVIKTLSATDVKVDAGYIEFNTDADQKVILSIPLDGLVPYVQLQIMAGTAGATPGQVDSLYTTKAWSGAGGGF